MPLLSTSGIGITYGADVIFANINVEINERARIGIVGPNGGGKTSLLKILVGELEPSADRVTRLMRGLERATGFLRRELGQRLQIRYTPELKFLWDETTERAQRVEELLEEIRHEGDGS